MTSRNYLVTGAAASVAFVVFLILAQSNLILIPYLTPAIIETHGLNDRYTAGSMVTFSISVKGYGSNCHMLQAEVTNQTGGREYYYRKADDCRYMVITHGAYDLTRTFKYNSETLEEHGTYKLDIKFEDLKDGTQASTTRFFVVQ